MVFHGKDYQYYGSEPWKKGHESLEVYTIEDAISVLEKSHESQK